MKSKKSIILAALGILMITAGIMYRKYRKAELREQQMEIQRQKAKELMEYQRVQDSIKRKKEYDSLQELRRKEFNKKYDKVNEGRKKLQETMRKLQEQTQ